MATRLPSAWSFFTSAALSWGRTSASTRSIPTWAAIARAVFRESPVIIATSIPSLWSWAMAAALESFTTSATAMMPARTPSRATNIGVFPSPARRSISAVPGMAIPDSSISLRFPRSTVRPSTTASMPRPGMALKEEAAAFVAAAVPADPDPAWPGPAVPPGPLFEASAAALTMASPRGCSDPLSAEAASRRRELRSKGAWGRTSVTAGSPFVMVPVLSNTIVSIRWAVSRASPDLKRTPFSAPLPVPTMMAVGVASPRAQGQAITRTAMKIERAKTGVWPATSQATAATRATAKTAGTK